MNEYFPEVAWRTIVDNVTVAPTPHYYTVDVFPLDSNEPGADPLDIAIGYWLIDNGGYTYLITDVSGNTITVYDINERSWGDSYIGPLEDLPGYVYKTKNGAFLLSQSQLRFLDKSAPDILYPIEKGIIWKYRGIEINALYGDGEVVETITEDSVDNITKLSLSSEFILRTEEDGWQGGKKYSLSLDGLLHNTLPDVQGTGLDDDYIHLDQDQVDALWTKVGNDIRRDSRVGIGKDLEVEGIGQFGEDTACVQIGFDMGGGDKGLYDPDGDTNIAILYSDRYYAYGQGHGVTNLGLFIKNGNVGVKTHDPQDSFHTVGYARISTLAETGNSSLVTSNADGRLIKLPYDNNESKYLRSDGTWAPILTSVGDFLDSVIRMVVDSTFNPGTPSNGDRYIILNASSIHANFGTINKFSDGSALTLGNNDIVQYYSTHSEFRIVYDSSAAMQPATVTVGTDKNGNTNHQWTYNVTDDMWADRGAAINHNSLDGLNDGDYKHLTATQYTNFISLTDGSDVSNTLHNHNTVYYTKTNIDAFFAGTIAKTGYNKSNWDTVVTDFAGLEIGGRNLLLDSGRTVSNGHYNIARYDLTDKPKEGERVTVTIKGTLAPTKSNFRVYNSGGSVLMGTLSSLGGGIYRLTFNWIIGSSNNTYLNVYAFTSSQSGTSTIEWIKLEKGNKATDWSPAPEDQVSDWNTTDVNSFSFIKNKPINPVTGTGTAGQVSYWNGAGSQAGSANLVWDNTNSRLGIGGAPLNPLHLITDKHSNSIQLERTGVNASTWKIGFWGTGLAFSPTAGSFTDASTLILSDGKIGINKVSDGNALDVNGIGSFSTGLAICKTTVIPGYRLDVNGAIQSTGLKVGTLSGLLKASSGVVGAAVSGTDIKTVATNSILGSGSLINITISATEPSTSGKLNGDIWVES